MSKTLVAYFSVEGNTANAAKKLAEFAAADIFPDGLRYAAEVGADRSDLSVGALDAVTAVRGRVVGRVKRKKRVIASLNRLVGHLKKPRIFGDKLAIAENLDVLCAGIDGYLVLFEENTQTLDVVGVGMGDEDAVDSARVEPVRIERVAYFLAGNACIDHNAVLAVAYVCAVPVARREKRVNTCHIGFLSCGLFL